MNKYKVALQQIALAMLEGERTCAVQLQLSRWYEWRRKLQFSTALMIYKMVGAQMKSIWVMLNDQEIQEQAARDGGSNGEATGEVQH